MKKHLTLLSVLGIVSLLVTGCNFVNPNSNTSQGDKSGSSLPNSSSEPISSSKELQKFTITWKNFDGTVLEVDENVLEGTTPTYDGLAPVKIVTHNITTFGLAGIRLLNLLKQTLLIQQPLIKN